MPDYIVEFSRKIAEERRRSPHDQTRMDAASQGQAPRFLLISPISRSFQDIDLLGFSQGDAFYGSRVPGVPLSSKGQLPILLGGPISYNEQFSAEDGIIVTFDMDEPYDAVRITIDNLASYTETRGIPIIGIRVDYNLGRGRLVPHSKGRNYELENRLISALRIPSSMDPNTLVLVCSDSRIVLNHLPSGAPMAIRALGGFISQFDESSDETQLLDRFFEKWLSSNPDKKRVIILPHGSSEYEKASCGAAESSLLVEEIVNGEFHTLLTMMNLAASQHEDEFPQSPKDRAISIALAAAENLKSYPSIAEASKRGFDVDSRIQVMFIDTVTNVINTIE